MDRAYAKKSGIYQPCDEAYAKQGGAYVMGESIFKKQGGVYTKFYQRYLGVVNISLTAPPSVPLILDDGDTDYTFTGTASADKGAISRVDYIMSDDNSVFASGTCTGTDSWSQLINNIPFSRASGSYGWARFTAYNALGESAVINFGLGVKPKVYVQGYWRYYSGSYYRIYRGYIKAHSSFSRLSDLYGKLEKNGSTVRTFTGSGFVLGAVDATVTYGGNNYTPPSGCRAWYINTPLYESQHDGTYQLIVEAKNTAGTTTKIYITLF